MQMNDIELAIGKSRSLREAMLRVTSTFGGGKIQFMFYGFFIHLHGRDRNDTLFCHTAGVQSFADIFLAAGGTNTDVVAASLEHVTDPYPLDLVGMVQKMRDERDFRLNYVESILNFGVKTAWICPINAPWVGGYGVLNQFYKERFAEPAIPFGELRAFAHKFHEAAKRHRLIAKEIKLRSSQIDVLAHVAMGKSADDLAEKYSVSSRAIEKRLENIRQKLRARNTLEAVYKATIYGVLPSPSH